nr:MAG TPA: hypothetical protein [Herelleviridae sp.]
MKLAPIYSREFQTQEIRNGKCKSNTLASH